jgi:hypothetical protein
MFSGRGRIRLGVVFNLGSAQRFAFQAHQAPNKLSGRFAINPRGFKKRNALWAASCRLGLPLSAIPATRGQGNTSPHGKRVCRQGQTAGKSFLCK